MKFDLGGLKDCLRTASVVGAGGAGFPSYMKLSAGADTLLINGAECEPLLETDFVLVRDHLSEVVAGARAVMEAASIPTCLLCMKKHNLPRLGLADGEKIVSLEDIASRIQRVTLDKQGRFALNPDLAEFSGITDQAVFKGAIAYGTLMSPASANTESPAPSNSSFDKFVELEAEHRNQKRGERS